MSVSCVAKRPGAQRPVRCYGVQGAVEERRRLHPPPLAAYKPAHARSVHENAHGIRNVEKGDHLGRSYLVHRMSGHARDSQLRVNKGRRND